MKKQYLILLTCFLTLLGVFTMKAQTEIPYLPQLDNFGGSSVNTGDFLPPNSDYTLEVQGSEGVEISIADGVLTYTPATNDVVRFSQKNGVVYVYEGNEYKTILTPNPISVVYPDIYSDADDSGSKTGIYNEANLVANPGFETTTGENLHNEEDKRYAPADWIATTGYSALGVRVNVDNDAFANGREGLATLLWRNDGADVNNKDTYFYQSLGNQLKANTAYQIKLQVLTHDQSRSCNWLVGVGSTEGGYEYSQKVFNTTNVNFTVQTFDFVFVTPSVVAEETYFTIGNAGDANSSTWTLIHLDRIAMVEGDAVTGITGVSSATYLEGSAYAPTVALASGEYFDMTSYIVNPNFDNGITGWTSTTTAQNNTTATNQGFGAFEGTMPFWENWNGSPYTGKMYQVVNGLPAGRYRLQIGVFANEGGEGLFVYAGDSETAVSDADPAANFTTEVVIGGGSLEIGLNIKSGINNWVGIDNVKLHYLGEVSDPVLSVAGNNLFFTESATEQIFTVTGANLIDDVTFSTDVDGVTFSPASIAKDAAGLSDGIEVTATFDPAAEYADTASGAITVSSTDVDDKTVAIVTSIDSDCFTPLYPELTNLAPDPFFNDASQMRGWGARSLVVDPSKAYCGAGVGFSNGGSYDQLILWEADKEYLVRAMVNANGTDVQLGVYGIGKSDITEHPVDKNSWELVEIIFTAGESPTTSGGVFFNGAGGTGAYIDNLEVYDITDLVSTSINKDQANGEINVYSRDMQIISEISTNSAANANITVYNLQGMRLHSENVVCNEGVNQFVINKDLPSGVYVIQIDINGVSHTVKLMK